MKFKSIAKLTLAIFDSEKSEWLNSTEYNLDQRVVTIGRAKDCDIPIFLPDYPVLSRAVSRYHCTLFYYPGNPDYMIRDGKPEINHLYSDELIASTASRLGVHINGIYRIEPCREKYQLKNGDSFHLILNKLKFIYSRPNKTLTEKLEDTYIPPEYEQ